MRQVSRTAHRITLLLATMGTLSTSASAQFFPNNNQNFSNQTYSYGLNLPQVPLPSGSDEIRAADGTTCKSNTASNGTYLDAGAIGSQDTAGSFNQGSVYARVIVPLGTQPKRLDCTALYHLEIERLQGELQLLRMGANSKQSASGSSGGKASWQNDGWSDSGWKANDTKMKAGGPRPIQPPVANQPVSPNAKPKKVSDAAAIGSWQTRVYTVVEMKSPPPS